MAEQEALNLGRFQFRGLHPQVSIGTASDRYAGWIGQIYSQERYQGRITPRRNKIGSQSFKEEVLPVESVEEYFQHFQVLEIDFTFYSLLLGQDRKPTQTYWVLHAYRTYLSQGDGLLLKVPQVICAQRLLRGGRFRENPDYLDPDIFAQRFYEPATGLLGNLITGFVFEQEYQPKKDRPPPQQYAEALGGFFHKLPEDHRYHMETRTEAYLTEPYFEMLENHGVGQVLSHWTWLPPVSKQFDRSGNRFFSSDSQSIIRLMTPLRVRYEDAYAQAFPFDKLVEGMLHPRMVDDTVEMISQTIDQGLHATVVINNRAGGNAPLIAQRISERFLEKQDEERRKEKKRPDIVEGHPWTKRSS